jgi:hypothetical protein
VVVVERAAAEFFEGRVLSVSPAALKVQTTEDGEPMITARSDAYRVAGVRGDLAPRAFAICNDRPKHWAPCRVVAVEGTALRVSLSTGAELSLPIDGVVKPSAVTALNISKTFEEEESRRRFAQAATGAGDPHRPPGWLPEVREPVIARHGSNWFTAHVLSMLEDGGVLVRLEGADRPESVPAAFVVPVPPYAHAFTRGDFALVRPSSATQPWPRVRVEAIGPEEAVVVGENGERRRFEARQLVPVLASPAR